MNTRVIVLLLPILLNFTFYSCKQTTDNNDNIETVDGQEFFIVDEPLQLKRGQKDLTPIDVTWQLNDNGPLNLNLTFIQQYFDSIKSTDFILKESRDCSLKTELGPSQILIGDINQDGHQDALIPFRFIKPNPKLIDKRIKFLFQNFYLITINNGTTLIPIEIFYAGNEEAELLIQFRSINENGEIIGKQVPNSFNKYPDEFDIKYQLKDGFLMAL